MTCSSIFIRAAIIVLLLSPAAFTTEHTKSTEKKNIKLRGLRGEISSSPVRIIAILENERMLEAEPNTKLVSFFASADPKIRARAILAATRIGNKAVLPTLKAHTNDPDTDVRRYVAFALGQIRSKEGLTAIIQMLKDQDPDVRRLAVEATGRIGGIEVSEIVLPFLNDENVQLREQAALALALIKDKRSVDPLIEKASQKDPAQWSYVYALYRLGDDRALQVLHRVIADPSESPSTGDPSSILFALKALWSMKKPLSTTEVDALLHHRDARVQQNVLDVVAASGDKSACETINKNYPAMNEISKWKALETIGVLQCALPAVDKNDVTLYGAELGALAKTKEAGLKEITTAASSASWVLRARVAQALSNFPLDSALPLLRLLVNDSDKAVKLTALDSLASFSPRTAEFFVPLLKDPDFAVRATAAEALGKTKDRKYLVLLIQAYRQSAAATEIEGRSAILDVLADFNTSEVLEIYEEALQDPEYTIRRHAIDGIKKLVGSELLLNGKIVDPENFLYRGDKVSAKIIASYPADFGEALPDYTADVTLEKGTVIIKLLGSDAPLLVSNFKKLADRGFYDGLRIHRVVPNFVIQGGDPRGDGWGGAGEVIHDQINLQVYKRGMVGLPIAGKDTGGSQFFITMSRQPHLDGSYTIFGEVISGMEFVDSTIMGDRILKIQIKASPTK